MLIPAHDEEQVIGGCLAAIAADRRPGDRVVVVADRCEDATAQIARAAGADVLERGPDEVPGRAAARQAGLELARGMDWDAVVMLDADSVIEPGFFAACEQALGTGASAVQGRSESSRGRTLAAEAGVAAFTLQGVTLPRGRDRLGLSVRLRGTGMAIRREVALGHRFTAPASEDLFFTLDLLLDGHRCRHVERARLRSLGASNWGTFGGQKVRYEAGRMAAAREYVPRLLRRAFAQRDAACLETAWFLASPPFALAALSLIAATAIAALAGGWVVAAVFGAALVSLALVIATGLDPGAGGDADVARAARGALVHRVEGRRPGAGARPGAAPRRGLRADGAGLTARPARRFAPRPRHPALSGSRRPARRTPPAARATRPRGGSPRSSTARGRRRTPARRGCRPARRPGGPGCPCAVPRSSRCSR